MRYFAFLFVIGVTEFWAWLSPVADLRTYVLVQVYFFMQAVGAHFLQKVVSERIKAREGNV